jgi:hypothetical protein
MGANGIASERVRLIEEPLSGKYERCGDRRADESSHIVVVPGDARPLEQELTVPTDYVDGCN